MSRIHGALTEKGAKRVLELQTYLNSKGRRNLTFDQVVEWAILRSYNRQRAVVRHSLSLKNEAVEVSPLEERHMRGKDDE